MPNDLPSFRLQPGALFGIWVLVLFVLLNDDAFRAMSSSNSPCAACKFLRRKCTQGCVFAPYFPPDQPNKFACVHRVFGASNVAKLLNDITPAQREDAVNSLAYEADARLKDPVYGCVAYISLLELRLRQLRVDLHNAKKELATYIGPAAFGPFLPSAATAVPPHHHQYHHQLQGIAATPFPVPGMGLGLATGGAATQSQMAVEAQQMVVVAAEAAREQEILRSYEQHQQQELARLSNVYDARGVVYTNAVQLGGGGGPTVGMAAAAGPPGGLSLVPPQGYESAFTTTNQQQPQQLMLDHHHQRAGSDEGRSGIGPSS